jgi:hypothetical protein
VFVDDFHLPFRGRQGSEDEQRQSETGIGLAKALIIDELTENLREFWIPSLMAPGIDESDPF